MTAAFFDAQWAVLCRRWPWDVGQEDAMRFFRDRLRLRAMGFGDELRFGQAVERLVAMPGIPRPSVDQIMLAAQPVREGYRPTEPVPAEERRRAGDTLRRFRSRTWGATT